VSGAAIGTDGQLTVYCHGDDGEPAVHRCGLPVLWHSRIDLSICLHDAQHNLADAVSQLCSRLAAGPCYRCLFPEAPAAGNCVRCVDAGVLGVVPGVIGTMQASAAPAPFYLSRAVSH
jgi:molybdopterin/thiamine biosynthesis adenylyltransferase